MSVPVEGLGPLVDLATAIGLVGVDDQLDPGWFADPAAKVGAMLRTPHQRDALLRAADALLGKGQPVELDAQGRHWIPLVNHGGVALNIVVAPGPAATLVGVGVTLDTPNPAPIAHVTTQVPLFAVPATGPATLAFVTGDGRITLDADIQLDSVAAHPGDVHLRGIALHADVLTNGTDPHLAITLQDLQLPGQTTPSDVGLSGTPTELGDQAVQLIAGLVQRSIVNASGPLAELLALIGISADARIPVLPVADLLTTGTSAWCAWLGELLAEPKAIAAWLEHVAVLVGPGASLSGSTGGSTGGSTVGQPAQVEWTLPGGVHLAAVVTVSRAPDGAPTVALGVETHVEATGTPTGRLELSTTLARITLGAVPEIAALPQVQLTGRLGKATIVTPADLLVAIEAPEVVHVGSLCVGLSLDADRRPGFVLAAHDVTVAAHSYPVLDLTNAHTLADIVGDAVGDVAAAVLGRLGAAGTAVSALLGVTAPPLPGGAAPWPVELTGLPALLTDPVGAVLGYYRRVLDTARDRYPTLLEPLRELLRTAGVDIAVNGAGTPVEPWQLAVADGVALLVWAEGTAPVRLHLALGVNREVIDLGGGCPTVTLALVGELVDVALDSSGGHAVPGLHASLVLGARGGAPLRLGTADTALIADRAGVSLDWSPSGGFGASLIAPGLAAQVDGELTPFALPRVQPDGTLSADVPWRALELLAGHVLVHTGLTWAADLADLTGWLPGGSVASPVAAARVVLPLQVLVADPVTAIQRWVADLVATGRLSVLARRVALALSGEIAPGVPAGVHSGHGTKASPYVIPVVGDSVGSAVRAELLLWGPGVAPDVDAFRPGALFGPLTATPGAEPTTVTGGALVAALREAAVHSQGLRDALTARDDLATGFDGLIPRWTGTDGLVRAADATLPGAFVVDLPGITHSDFADVDLAAVAGVFLDAGTVIASGPLGPTSWPGIPADHVLDWRAPALPPEAFDDASVRAGSGPWLVLIPTRAQAVAAAGEDGATRQADRLARAVDAVAAALAAAGNADQVSLAGIGAAGHAATAVAARGHVGVLVTVGTPHGGIGLDVLEAQPVAGALQLLAALLPPVEAAEVAAVALGRSLLAPLLAAYDATSAPLADLAPPGTAPGLPDELEVWCVRGVCDATSVTNAVTGLVVRALQEAYENQTEAGVAAPDAVLPGEANADGTVAQPTGVGLGLALTTEPPAGPGELSVRTSIALTGEPFPDAVHPGCRLRIELGRVGGWLAGGPDPARPADVARHPSLRRASIELDLTGNGEAAARIVLHEASVFGVARPRWVLSHSEPGADPLLPEARIVLGRLADALAAATSPAVQQATDLLAALGLSDTVSADGFAFSVDGLRRLLVDPAGLLRDVTGATSAPALARALAALAGAPVPSPDAPTQVSLTVDGVQASVDVATAAVRIGLGDLVTPLGMHLSGTLELAADQTLAGTLQVAFGSATSRSGRPVLEVTGGAGAGAVLRWEGGGAALPASVRLAPTPDGRGLAELLTAAVPAQVLWAGITFLRSLQPGAVALVDPLLTALGLLEGSGNDARVAVPVGLLRDPEHWLRDTDPAQLVDAAGTVLGLPSPRSGAWTLPYGLEFEAVTVAGRTLLALRLDEPVAGTGLRVAGSLGITLAADELPASPTAELVLGTPAATPLASSGRISLGVDSSGVTARLVLPGSGVDLALLPSGPGLASLGSAAAVAVTYALPYVLDTIAGLPSAHTAHPIGQALAALGDAMDLRAAGRFSADELRLLASDPVGQLAQRLRRHALPDAIDALVDLLATAVPTGYSLSRSGDDLVLARVGTVTVQVRVSVPDTGGLPTGARLTASATGVHPFAGAQLETGLTVDPTGLIDAHVTSAVSPVSGLQLGPLTLAPVAQLAVGSAATGGARIAAGLALDGGRQVLGVQRFGPPVVFALEATGGTLGEVLAELLIPIAMDLALATSQVQALLERQVLGGPTLRELLDGVLFSANAFDAGALDADQLWARLLRLAANIAGHSPSLPVSPLAVGTAHRTLSDGSDVYGISVTVPPGQRFRLVDADVTVDVEVDDSWVGGVAAPSGITLELLRIHSGAPSAFFGLDIRGVGLRIGRSSGPLLETFLSVDSVALHALLAVSTEAGITDLGGQLELTGLALGVGSGEGGTNKVATGVLRDAASGSEPPRPRFSPALSVQRHGGGTAHVDLRAGEGEGPWWVSLQRSFGPVYIEQVGFGVSRSGEQVCAARVLVDGKITLMGLLVAVDGLSLGARWPQNPGDAPLYDPRAWEVGLDGLAVAADTGGIQISGGLRKGPGALPDYVGMISIRFGVYALSAYGGYGVVTDSHGDFTSLFIYGALNAPIGGPPAFFVTGIGAGVGINRLLLLPKDLGQFGSYPLLQALDQSSPMADPDRALEQLRAYFPAARGAFWFAAGLSFTSFALVEGIAVVGVAIGDGLDINLLGLARAALPTPDFPLVQIELALLVRFSTREGVLWVQAQLTDNSFLLTKDCRLTGGFAYVLWFAGSKAGEFVLTLGGYHPSFHRDGYPVVPRLGYVWGVSDVLVIKGESYFALTSEAMMMGTRFEASLQAGPLWAYLRLGVDGIVYFDPFHFQVTAYAELGAGITIDIDLGWFGHVRITISVSLHADVVLEGPQFRGKATIDLDVTSATIAFGDWSDRSTTKLDWARFAAKYLAPGGAAVLTATPGRGTLPPSTEGSRTPPTGAAADPFLVLPEFELSLATTAATSAVTAGGPVPLPFGVFLAIGPMQTGQVSSTLAVSVIGADRDWASALAPTPTTGAFPTGVWGPQPQSEPKPVPSGHTVEAVNGLHLQASPIIAPGTVPIDYHQVEVGARHQLPFLAETAVRGQRASDVAAADALAAVTPSEVPQVLATARTWLTTGAQGSALTRYGAAVFATTRSAPPQLVPLTYGMAIDPGSAPDVPPAEPDPQRPPDDTRAHPFRIEALLATTPTVAQPRIRLTVGERGTGLPRTAPRTRAQVRAGLDERLAIQLVTAGGPAARTNTTLLAAGTAAVTGRAGVGSELRMRPGTPPWQTQRMIDATEALLGDGAGLLAGEVAVLATPNALRDVESLRPALIVSGGLPVRIVAMDLGGTVTRDLRVSAGTVLLPAGTDRVVLVGGAGPASGSAGWYATAPLLQTGASTLLGPGCTVTSSSVRTQRGGQPVATAFVPAAEAVVGWSVITTRLPANVRAVAVVLESADRVDDERGDALELGLTGVRRTTGPAGTPLPPAVVVSGSRTVSVFTVEPAPSSTSATPLGQPFAGVTVASGEHVHLSGVLGSTADAGTLVTALREHGVEGAVGALVTAPDGSATVRWLSQDSAPDADDFQEVS